MGSLFSDIFAASPDASGYSSGSDFVNTNLFNSDLNNVLSNQALDTNAINATLNTPTFAPSTYGGPSVVNPSSSSSLTNQLENLITPGFNAAASILKTKYSVPDTSQGQYFSRSANGAITTGTLPYGTSVASAAVAGGFSMGSLLLLGAAGLLLFVLTKK